MQEEQTLICYGLRGALQGLIEQGCDGPCKDALNLLDKHLNKEAHGVTVDGDKLDALIESAVYELKNGFLTIEGGLPGAT